MTVWVFRDGGLVDKRDVPPPSWGINRSDLSSPRVSRFETFTSPIDDETSISSWRQRDKDMDAAGAVDPRDLPREPFERRAAEHARRTLLGPQWGQLDPDT